MQAADPVHVVGGFTIDAIIRADGTWATGQLGGNALWAACGMATLAAGRPIAHSVIGDDYPADALALMRERGIDVSGVRREPAQRNARVTFEYRNDGSRTQPAPAGAVAVLPERVRPEFADTTRDAALTLSSLPDREALRDVASASGGRWHLGLLPGTRFAELVTTLRAGGAAYVQSDCPARFELRRDGDAVLREHLCALDAFLPSSSDTDVFAPDSTPLELVARFHRYGAPVVVLKRGELGAIVSDARTGEVWSIPAVPVGDHLDATGAGDVFCGVFAHSRAAGHSLIDAAVQATVAASCALQVASPLALERPAATQWQASADMIREGVTPL